MARKTARLVEHAWKPSPGTDAGGEWEFWYQPGGWGNARRLPALRYEKDSETAKANQPEQYQ